MLADVDAMAHQIAIEEDRVARDAAMAQPTSSPITAKPNAQDGKPVHFRATAEYREDFLNLVRGKRPFITLWRKAPLPPAAILFH